MKRKLKSQKYFLIHLDRSKHVQPTVRFQTIPTLYKPPSIRLLGRRLIYRRLQFVFCPRHLPYPYADDGKQSQRCQGSDVNSSGRGYYAMKTHILTMPINLYIFSHDFSLQLQCYNYFYVCGRILRLTL